MDQSKHFDGPLSIKAFDCGTNLLVVGKRDGKIVFNYRLTTAAVDEWMVLCAKFLSHNREMASPSARE